MFQIHLQICELQNLFHSSQCTQYTNVFVIMKMLSLNYEHYWP